MQFKDETKYICKFDMHLRAMNSFFLLNAQQLQGGKMGGDLLDLLVLL